MEEEEVVRGSGYGENVLLVVFMSFKHSTFLLKLICFLFSPLFILWFELYF